MERLPLDIIINHIIPYTYEVQPNLLLKDIQNYFTINSKIMDDKYDTNIIKHEILAIFYMNKPKLNNILYRHYQINMKKIDYNIIYNYPQDTKFKILFGLFTKEERTHFSEYIFNELREWIIK